MQLPGMQALQVARLSPRTAARALPVAAMHGQQAGPVAPGPAGMHPREAPPPCGAILRRPRRRSAGPTCPSTTPCTLMYDARSMGGRQKVVALIWLSKKSLVLRKRQPKRSRCGHAWASRLFTQTQEEASGFKALQLAARGQAQRGQQCAGDACTSNAHCSALQQEQEAESVWQWWRWEGAAAASTGRTTRAGRCRTGQCSRHQPRTQLPQAAGAPADGAATSSRQRRPAPRSTPAAAEVRPSRRAVTCQPAPLPAAAGAAAPRPARRQPS